METVWIFNGETGRFPSGAFGPLDKAEAWIRHRGLSGVLTAYPQDKGAYDLALEKGWFGPERENEMTPEFIASFSDARQGHYHYENGE